jgi:2-polyprenyl-3-methyl-5-hydroxy-6-metoxy-1,4-benzoquinol methylase
VSQSYQTACRHERFEFGENWKQFLSVLNDERIAEAERSLKRMLGVASLEGKRFLDIGSGSGLFSLAARRLGASVHSFDYDPKSVACTKELRQRFSHQDADWVIEAGSALDADYLKTLGQFDVVYSWGVLHHTGNMQQALENADIPVREGGKLFIAIYNDQGRMSRTWKTLKQVYNKLPKFLQLPFAITVMGVRELRSLLAYASKFQFAGYVRSWTDYQRARGMSRWHDLIDWIGGYPFEVAKPEVIFDFYKAKGYRLERMKTCGGSIGCNEFVFTRNNHNDQ